MEFTIFNFFRSDMMGLPFYINYPKVGVSRYIDTNGFFDRLLNLDSLAIFHRSDQPHNVRQSKRTLTLKRPEAVESNDILRDPVAERLDYLFGSFVEYVRESKPELVSIMADVATGSLIAEVVFGVQSPPSKGDEFSETDIYLDAPLVMDLLGINPGRKEYAQDLLAALKTCNARVWLFDHSVDEIERIIARRLEATDRSASQRLGYQYRGTVAVTDKLYLASLKGHVANAVQKLGLKINSLQGDPYHRSLKYFSEDDELELMGRIGTYMYAEAKEADAKSLAHVIRLRGASDISSNVLRSRAFLVSRNGRLVGRAARYLAGKQDEARLDRLPNSYRAGDAPVCITDNYLLGLIWITRGGTTKSLSRSRLIANCASAVVPRRDLVAKMFNLLLDCDEQKADRFEAIMIDERAERYLMNLTLGDASLVTNDNVEALYEDVRRATAQELTEEHEKQLAKITATHQMEAEALRAELSGRLLDQQADSLAARQKLKDIEEQLQKAVSSVARFESALQSERQQRLLPAFRAAKTFRRRFPVMMGILTAAVLFSCAKYLPAILDLNTNPLVSNLASFVLAVAGFVLAFWEVPVQVFSPVRNRATDIVFATHARSDGAGDLLTLYEPDWVNEELRPREKLGG